MKKGFTLIEMMVAVTIFSIVMLVGVGALLSLIEANHRTQAIHSVMSNLNAALESMSRSIRVGTAYHCQGSATPLGDLETQADCATGGGLLLAFESSQGDINDADDQVVYRWIDGDSKRLERSLDSGDTWVALTAPEVSIDSFEFFIIGSAPASGSGSTDTIQPRVIMRLRGSAPVPGGRTEFSVQASVTQRLLDI